MYGLSGIEEILALEACDDADISDDPQYTDQEEQDFGSYEPEVPSIYGEL